MADRHLFTSAASRTKREVADAGDGLERSPGTVLSLSERLGLDVSRIDVVIVVGADEIDYLDAHGACACTPVERGGGEIRLGPAAFSDEDTLARTLAHELVHVDQLRRGADVSNLTLASLEAEAYDAEDEVARRLEEPRS